MGPPKMCGPFMKSNRKKLRANWALVVTTMLATVSFCRPEPAQNRDGDQYPNCEVLVTQGIERDKTITCMGSEASDEEVCALIQTVPAGELSKLALSKTSITDRSLYCAAEVAALEILEISETQISSRGLYSLSAHPSLSDLDLQGNGQIDDSAINALLSIPNLRGLTVYGTGISERGLARLRDAGIGVLADDHHL